MNRSPVWQALRRLRWWFRPNWLVYRTKPNPWRHGGRRGKKRPVVTEWKTASSRREYRQLLADGWSPNARPRTWRNFRVSVIQGGPI